MDKFVTKRNDLLAEQVIKNLKSRQMEGHYVQTKEEALALALELIPEGSSISWGGSMSIKAIGLPEALHKGNYKVLDRDLCATPEEKAEMMHQALNCDYFLASCNAISEDGILVNIDGNANRVAAISYGPENVLMIVGMNKIVRSAEDAYARAKYVAAPINGQRFEGLPCAKTGVCSNCKSPKSIVEIAEMLGVNDRRWVRKKYIAPYIGTKLQMTIPDKPNSQNQKYVIINDCKQH